MTNIVSIEVWPKPSNICSRHKRTAAAGRYIYTKKAPYGGADIHVTVLACQACLNRARERAGEC